jgi:hypothetical protein
VEKRIVYMVLVRKVQGKRHLGRRGVFGKIILKWGLRK